MMEMPHKYSPLPIVVVDGLCAVRCAAPRRRPDHARADRPNQALRQPVPIVPGFRQRLVIVSVRAQRGPHRQPDQRGVRPRYRH